MALIRRSKLALIPRSVPDGRASLQTVPGALRETHHVRAALQHRTHDDARGLLPPRRSDRADQLHRWRRAGRRTAEPGDALPNLVVNPLRPDRAQPRVRKRRPKEYDLMSKPPRRAPQGLVGTTGCGLSRCHSDLSRSIARPLVFVEGARSNTSFSL